MASRTADSSARGRSNRNRGLQAERDLAGFLRASGWPEAERAVATGWSAGGRSSADPGDIKGTPGIVWSVKYYDGGLTDGQVDLFLAEAEQMVPFTWITDEAYSGPVFLVERRARHLPAGWWVHARLSTLAKLYLGPFEAVDPNIGPAHARIRMDWLIPLLHRYGYGQLPDNGKVKP